MFIYVYIEYGIYFSRSFFFFVRFQITFFNSLRREYNVVIVYVVRCETFCWTGISYARRSLLTHPNRHRRLINATFTFHFAHSILEYSKSVILCVCILCGRRTARQTSPCKVSAIIEVSTRNFMTDYYGLKKVTILMFSLSLRLG